MTVNELRTKRANLWKSMENFLDTRRNDRGVLSAEDDASYAAMEKDLDLLTNEIKREERREIIEAELNMPVSTPLTSDPERAGNRGKEKTGRASAAYAEDFDRHLRRKTILHNVLSEGSESDGGYLVPEEFERQMVESLTEENVIRQLAKVITTQHERKIPVATGHSVAHWTAENATYTESNPTFAQKQIDAFKLTDLCRVSVELLQDAAFDIEDYLAKEFGRAFGIAEEEACCVGDGTTQPTGIFTENGGTVGVTAAGSNIVTAEELISLVYALKSPYRRNAKFLMNDTTVSAIRKLKDGNGIYMWQPSLTMGEPDKLLGFDLYTSPYAPAMSAGARSIAFGDFSHYWIGDRAVRTVQRLNELYVTNGQIGYVATERIDGKVILPEAIQLLRMKQ